MKVIFIKDYFSDGELIFIKGECYEAVDKHIGLHRPEWSNIPIRFVERSNDNNFYGFYLDDSHKNENTSEYMIPLKESRRLKLKKLT